MASEPHAAEAVDLVAGFFGKGMVGVGGKPLLDVGLGGRLELLPFIVARGLDPSRTEARGHGDVNEVRQAGKVGGGGARPQGGQVIGSGWALPEGLAKENTTARGDQATQSVDGRGDALGWPGVAEAWPALRQRTVSAGPWLVSTADSRRKRTRSARPRSSALARPRARSSSLRSMPMPVAPRVASSRRSMISPQPQPMSSTVVVSARDASLRIIFAARSSESGPWKVSWVIRGGPAVSSMRQNATAGGVQGRRTVLENVTT